MTKTDLSSEPTSGISAPTVFINDIDGSTSAVISPQQACGSEPILQARRSVSRAFTGLAAVVFILRLQ
jgi:hypothetical protein